jgi:chromosome segregation ATPase
MNQPSTATPAPPAGIPLERLIGGSGSQESAAKTARESKAASVRAGITRMRAEYDAVRDERDYLRGEVDRLHSRMESVEGRLREVTVALRTADDAQNDNADALKGTIAELQATVNRLTEAFLPDEDADAEEAAPELTTSERARRWIVGLFRDDEEYYVN